MFDAFWADPHFGHKMLIEKGHRPYDTVEEMNEALIERYNEVVHDDMLVAWLGDCFFTTTPEAKEIMKRLNGRKFLIWGGHDKTFSAMLRLGFCGVAYTMDIQVAGITCTLSHFPFAGTALHDTAEEDTRFLSLRPKRKKGQILIHGHTHKNKKLQNGMLHVGVDAWAGRPARIWEVGLYVRDKLTVR